MSLSVQTILILSHDTSFLLMSQLTLMYLISTLSKNVVTALNFLVMLENAFVHSRISINDSYNYYNYQY